MIDLAAADIIAARTTLKAKVRKLRGRSPADHPVARAEAALATLATHFDGWMCEEVSRVAESRAAWAASGFAAGAAREAFHRAVHDIKGEAATLGFPLAAQVAASLCLILDRSNPEMAAPEALIRAHVDAIRAIVREEARDPDDPVGRPLAEALSRLAGLEPDPASDDPA
jgi:HPt (histidine-containing phosphotransfer) domain-containing protein